MSEHTDLLADGASSQEDQFEKEMRGYSRRQVDEFVARARSQVRDLEDRLARSLDDNERVRLELSSARQASDEKPAHAEISERVGQILKLADDEAKAQKNRAADEIAKLRNDVKTETEKLRNDVKQETEKFRSEAHDQADRMLNAAQEQAENSIASARAEAEKTRTAARAEAERSVTEAHKQAESAVGTAKAQAKQVMDEATARATAIHDGAERRLNLLMSRHTEAIRRLTEIRDVVTGLVAGEVARGSLEDEVAKAVANSIGAAEAQQAGASNGGRPQSLEGRHAPGTVAGMGQQQGQGRDLETEQAMRARAQAPQPARQSSDALRGPGGPASDPLRSGDPLRGPAAGDPLRGQVVPGLSEPAPGATSRQPAAQQSAAQQPAAQQSAAQQSAAQQPSAQQPSSQQPGTQRPGSAQQRERGTDGQADTGPQPTASDGAKHAAGSPQRP